MKMSGELHATAILPLGKEAVVSIVGGWVGPRARLDTGEEKNHAPLWDWTATIQPIAHCYTDWTVPASS
jgi:hypothetical protein